MTPSKFTLWSHYHGALVVTINITANSRVLYDDRALSLSQNMLVWNQTASYNYNKTTVEIVWENV